MTSTSDGPTGDVESPLAPAILASLLVILLLATCIVLPVSSDEKQQYEHVILQASIDWPGFNTTDVGYGVSIIYQWIVGGLAPLIGNEVLVGRLVSWGSYSALILSCFRGLRLVHPLALQVLLHPAIMVSAVRLHPLTPGLALFFAAALWSVRVFPISLALIYIAANVQNFLLPSVILIPFTGRSKGLGRGAGESSRPSFLTKANLARVVLVSMAGFAGVATNWLLYGGRYPPGFTESPTYYALNSGSPSLGYLAVVPAFVGFWGWIFQSPEGWLRQAGRIAWCAMALLLAAIVGVLGFASAPAIGALANTARQFHLAEGYIPLLCLFALGWLRFPRDQRLWMLAIGTAAMAIAQATLPWFYERYAWYAANTVVLCWCLTGRRDASVAMSDRYALVTAFLVLWSMIDIVRHFFS